MKLAKSLLLGSAAGLCAVAGAQAADLPMRKAAPVEYVRVCTAYGAGFFYIPGTDTCLRVGGRARFEYQYTSQRARTNTDQSGFRAFGRLNLDARTQTAFGTLRTFVRFDIQSRTGAYLTSGTQQRYANAFPGLGQDQFGHNQKYVELDKAFIQIAGFTAGRAASFYDFYAHDVEMIGASIGSDAASTNLLAYTATFGGGFSATLSVEDPVFRRNPTFGTGFSAFGGTAAVSPIFGPAGVANIDVRQTNVVPDIIGVLRYDSAWGSAQVSAAMHEIRTGNFVSGSLLGSSVGIAAAPKPEYGYAVQGGLKLNVPQLAPGDVLWLQAAYGKGAGDYTGIYSPQGREALGNTYTNRFAGNNLPGGFDAAVTLNGKMVLTESWSGTIAFTHYWTPELRSSIFGTYGRASFDKSLRSNVSPVIGPFVSAAAFAAPTAAGGLFSGFGRDYSNIYVGGNTIWSPIKDFDVGAELAYERIEFLGGASKGRVIDSNKPVTVGGVARTIKYDDNFLARIRVQRDF